MRIGPLSKPQQHIVDMLKRGWVLHSSDHTYCSWWLERHDDYIEVRRDIGRALASSGYIKPIGDGTWDLDDSEDD